MIINRSAFAIILFAMMIQSCKKKLLWGIAHLSNTTQKRCPVVGVFVFMFLLCSSGAGAVEKLPVFVSVAPQKFFVEKVGGDAVDIAIMVPPGADAHTFEPKPQQMVALSKARIYFSSGVEFERVWLNRFTSINPDMLVVHTDQGIEKIPMVVRHHHGENSYRPETDCFDKVQGKDDTEHLFVQPQFSLRSAALVAKEIGGQVVVADPLAADWSDNLRNVAGKFKSALK